jgi:phage terminase large subunit-like protein
MKTMKTTYSTDLHHPTTKYALDVMGGEIVAGKYVRLACERHLNDLKRVKSDESFLYVFDEGKANKVFSFAENHCKHIEDGLTVKKGDPIVLDDFLFFIIGCVFGWVHAVTRMRRFRKAYEQVGRKNAKSTTLSVVGLNMFAADGEGGPQIYTAATKKDQAKIVYNAAEKMAEQDKKLKKKIKFKKSRSIMTHKINGGIMMPLSREDKEMDGFNPHCGIIDEYHAHKTSEMYDIIVSGMGMRRQPLIFIITTAGFDTSRPCYDEYLYCKKILDGEVENDEYFVYIAEMDEDDDINDETNWIKCNPLLAKTEDGRKYLRSELKIAQEQPSKRRGVLTKNFNRWLDERNGGYMNMSKWRRCGANKENPFPDVRGHVAVTGMDLSKKIDLTSVGFEIPLMDGRFAVLSHSFIPKETLDAKRESDDVPYDLWVSEGYITVTPGAVVDYKFVQKYIVDQYKKYGWSGREVCYDEWSAGLISQDLKDDDFIMIEIPQRITTLSEPTKNFRERVYSREIIHDNNPVLEWALKNAIETTDPSENIKLNKAKSTQRIDPIVALINAHTRAVFAKPTIDVSKFAEEDFLKKLWG